MAEIMKIEGLSEAANRYVNMVACGPEMLKRFKVRVHIDLEFDLYDIVLSAMNSSEDEIDLDSITMQDLDYLKVELDSLTNEDITEEILKIMPPEAIEAFPPAGRNARVICKGADVVRKRHNNK